MTAYNKVWVGTTGDYQLVTNWKAISIRTSAWSWTASGSGTNEYYLRTSGSASPGFGAAPGSVQINGSDATSGTPGSLAAGRYGYGDNDTLGYSTIYVRLSDGTDPDSKALDYVTFKQVPVATDNVRIPAGAGSISSNLDNTSVALGSFIVEKGYTGTIASSSAYLRVGATRFEFDGSGLSYIDLGASSVSPQVFSTSSAGDGLRGLYLLGSAMATVNVVGGQVGVAVNAGETATITTATVTGGSGSLWLGAGVSLTTFTAHGGSNVVRCTGTTMNIRGGTTNTEEVGTFTTQNIYGGTLVRNSTGTVTTLNSYGGSVDDTQSNAVRTTTTTNKYKGGSIKFNKEACTYTTVVVQDSQTLSG